MTVALERREQWTTYMQKRKLRKNQTNTKVHSTTSSNPT
jgi:hypothetical protein